MIERRIARVRVKSSCNLSPSPERVENALVCLLYCCNVFLHYDLTLRLGFAMATLTVTTRGQVTFRKDVLRHLGIRPGAKIDLEKLPNGRVILKAARPVGKIDDFIGLLAGKTSKVATLDEIDEAAAAGWAGRG